VGFRIEGEVKTEVRIAQKNRTGASSLRGQGAPAYPARLRSVRARNLLPQKTFKPGHLLAVDEHLLAEFRYAGENLHSVAVVLAGKS